ncbi:MAG TPA: Mth938-like domain-containing protein [Burkholderiaceae bacterium]|jgi:uncharacterized protein|nr:Mth938-like domain-containing protein [Burkholderiaceae bacterium]
MKLQSDDPTPHNQVTGYGAGWIEVNGERHQGSMILVPDAPVVRWAADRFEELAVEHFEVLAQRQPEVVLIGTGARHRFPHPRLTEPLARLRIGVEVMDTQAACRTYNILMAEGRRVVAALISI